MTVYLGAASIMLKVTRSFGVRNRQNLNWIVMAPIEYLSAMASVWQDHQAQPRGASWDSATPANARFVVIVECGNLKGLL